MSTTIPDDEQRVADQVTAPPSTGQAAAPKRPGVPIMLAVVPAMGEE